MDLCKKLLNQAVLYEKILKKMGKHKEYDRLELIRAAMHEFFLKGYANTSVQDIERATGVNKSGIYSEFNSKDELFAACLKNYSEESGIFETLENAPRGWGNIRQLLLRLANGEEVRGCFVVNSVSNFRSLPKVAKSVIETHISMLEEKVIENLVKAGLSLSQARRDARIILSFGSGLAVQANVSQGSDLVAQVDQFLKLIIN